MQYKNINTYLYCNKIKYLVIIKIFAFIIYIEEKRVNNLLMFDVMYFIMILVDMINEVVIILNNMFNYKYTHQVI